MLKTTFIIITILIVKFFIRISASPKEQFYNKLYSALSETNKRDYESYKKKYLTLLEKEGLAGYITSQDIFFLFLQDQLKVCEQLIQSIETSEELALLDDYRNRAKDKELFIYTLKELHSDDKLIKSMLEAKEKFEQEIQSWHPWDKEDARKGFNHRIYNIIQMTQK